MKVTPDVPGVNDPGPGRRLGIDVGTVRIGVASSDRNATLATPVETIPRVTGFKGRDGADIDRLIELIEEYRAVEVVLGLPRDLKGDGSHSVKHAKEIAFRIRRRLNNPDSALSNVAVRLGDERLTTVVALRAMRESGVGEKEGRKFIDQAAAVEILQTWLDTRANHLAQNSLTPPATPDTPQPEQTSTPETGSDKSSTEQRPVTPGPENQNGTL